MPAGHRAFQAPVGYGQGRMPFWPDHWSGRWACWDALGSTSDCCVLCVCQSCSNVTLFAWVVFYWALFINLKTYHVNWRMLEWDVVGADGMRAHEMLDNMTNWSAYYGYGRTCAVCCVCMPACSA